MEYFFKSIGFWDYIFLNTENPKLVLIVFKCKDLKNDAKLKRYKKHRDKIFT